MTSKSLFIFFTLFCLSGCSEIDLFRAEVYFAIKNDEEAVRLFTKSAEAGNGDAQYRMGYLYRVGQAFEKNYDKSVYWNQKGADQNHAGAIGNLGYMYEKGYGVRKDIKKAKDLYLQAAELDNPQAMANIGILYERGRGVGKDISEAIRWYQLASELGHEPSMRYLAEFYEQGIVFDMDKNKALELYKKSNTRIAKRRYNDLKRKMSCSSEDATKLFNVSIKCADREEMRKALSLTKAEFMREFEWSETYSSSLLLKGSSKLKIDYNNVYKFIQATYTFPSQLDVDQVVMIQNLVASKYGKPSSVDGQANVGPISYNWILKDGIEITVRRDWPNTTTYMSYRYPELHDSMVAKIEKEERKKNTKEFQSQNSAF